MKSILFLITIILVTNVELNAQKIKKNVVDKFTKLETIETSCETLYSKNFMGAGVTHTFDFIIRRYGGDYVIAADILMNDIVKYTENDGITFLLDNGETIILKTNYTGVGGKRFANGYYFSTSFNLTKDDVIKMKKHKITDVRISYLGGAYDHQLKDKKQSLIQRMLNLFNDK